MLYNNLQIFVFISCYDEFMWCFKFISVYQLKLVGIVLTFIYSILRGYTLFVHVSRLQFFSTATKQHSAYASFITYVQKSGCSYFIIYQFEAAVVLFSAHNFSFIRPEVYRRWFGTPSTISIHRKHILFPVVLPFSCARNETKIHAKARRRNNIIFFSFKQLSLFYFQHILFFFFDCEHMTSIISLLVEALASH